MLTGDVVDAENKMYEAYGALERGLRRLLEAKVEVVAVAGNHDHDAFPRLVRTVEDDRLHLLGAGVQWDVVKRRVSRCGLSDGRFRRPPSRPRRCPRSPSPRQRASPSGFFIAMRDGRRDATRR